LVNGKSPSWRNWRRRKLAWARKAPGLEYRILVASLPGMSLYGNPILAREAFFAYVVCSCRITEIYVPFVDVSSASKRSAQTYFGGADEWHLVLGKAFRHLAFHLGAGLGQPVVVIAPPLFQPRLIPVGPVADPMGGDGIE